MLIWRNIQFDLYHYSLFIIHYSLLIAHCSLLSKVWTIDLTSVFSVNQGDKALLIFCSYYSIYHSNQTINIVTSNGLSYKLL